MPFARVIKQFAQGLVIPVLFFTTATVGCKAVNKATLTTSPPPAQGS